MESAELIRATWQLAYATWVLAGLNLVLAGGTLWFLRRQLRESKSTTALKLHLQYMAAWESDALQNSRSRVAATLLKHQDPIPNDIETILDNLEGMAYDANRGSISLDRVWNDFGYAVLCYWDQLSKYVVIQRSVRSDITLFQELEALDKTLRTQEPSRRRLHPKSAIPSTEELNAFLVSEATVEDRAA